MLINQHWLSCTPSIPTTMFQGQLGQAPKSCSHNRSLVAAVATMDIVDQRYCYCSHCISVTFLNLLTTSSGHSHQCLQEGSSCTRPSAWLLMAAPADTTVDWFSSPKVFVSRPEHQPHQIKSGSLQHFLTANQPAHLDGDLPLTLLKGEHRQAVSHLSSRPLIVKSLEIQERGN